MTAAATTCYRHPSEETRIRCTRCERPICTDCMTPAPVGHQCPQCVGEAARERRRSRFRLRRIGAITPILLGANVIVFLVQISLGGAGNLRVLVTMGAMVPERIAAGEYWRLITAMFLHVTLIHLLLNSFVLYLFGTAVESVFGRLRFAAIYFSTGLCGSAASFAFGGSLRISAGASGAIFGLLGAWLAYNWRRRARSLAQSNVRGALLLIGLNLVLGLSVPGIDNLAHLGGLVAGIAAGLAAEGFGPRGVRVATQIAGLAAVVLLAAGVTAWKVAALAPVGPLP